LWFLTYFILTLSNNIILSPWSCMITKLQIFKKWFLWTHLESIKKIELKKLKTLKKLSNYVLRHQWVKLYQNVIHWSSIDFPGRCNQDDETDLKKHFNDVIKVIPPSSSFKALSSSDIKLESDILLSRFCLIALI